MNALALKCAQLCAAAYDDADPRFLDIEELRFGVIKDGDTTFLVFRGTDNLQGWLDDFKAIPARTNGGYLAHAGFIGCVDKLRPAVEGLVPLGGNLVITGHSLGGAIAVLFAEEYKIDPAVTFGCPRVYSRLNRGFPTMEHTRFVNGGDLVTEVPDPLAWHHLCDPAQLGPDKLLDIKYHDIELYVSHLAGVTDRVTTPLCAPPCQNVGKDMQHSDIILE